MGQRDDIDHLGATAPRRSGLRWWLRPLPVVVGGLGCSLIAASLLGAGGGSASGGDAGETTAIALDLPGSPAAEHVAPPATTPQGGDGAAVAHAGAADIPQEDGGAALPDALDPPALPRATSVPDDAAAADSGAAESTAPPSPGPATPAEAPAAMASTASAAGEPEAAETGGSDPVEAPEWESIEVQSGDSLAALFERAGLGAGELYRLMNADDRLGALERIYPGDTIHFRVADDRLQGLRYELDDTDTLVVAREDDAFTARVETRELETRIEHASGTINTSLFVAGLDAGLDHGQIMRLMQILDWQVDFGRDVRAGDAFSIAYESYYLDGEHVRDGPIVAARYVNRGRQIDAVRYTDSEGRTGYYTPDGENLRKAFLRYPVSNARISSHYNPNRRHPVLGVHRPHRGTDFAARPGTPIKATGYGRVVHAGRKGGYGNTVIIEHANRYRTLYAHMSRVANGVRVGSRVEQGETIGYLGSTGLSTGPHLHYEFIRDGVHQNPMRVELPSGAPVAAEDRNDFRARASRMVARLDDMGERRLALQTDDE